MLENIDLLAVFIAAISAFVLGGIWYSPLLFGNSWQREIKLASCRQTDRRKITVFLLAFLLSLIAAAAFALILGKEPELNFAVGIGFITGLCWVATSFGINYLFARRSIKLFLIDAGYHILQFTLYGAVLGVWQ